MRSALVAATVATAMVLAPVAAPGEPADTALDAAVTSLVGLGYNIGGTSGSTASGGSGTLHAIGAFDPKVGGTLEFKGERGGASADITLTQVPDTLYAKIDIPSIQRQLSVRPDQWLRFDESRITDKSRLPFDLSGTTDALDIAGLLTSISHVTYANGTDPSHITGTVDLTAATGVAAPDPADLTKAGDAARTTPFRATIDPQGHLTDLVIDADSFDGDLTEDINLTDFGAQDPVGPPPDSAVISAPDGAYQLFNN